MAVTAKEIRQDFLNEVQYFVRDYVRMAHGEGIIPKMNQKAMDAVWDLAAKVILQTNDAQKFEIETTRDVLALLKDGKISVDESLALMNMLRTKSEAEILPGLDARLSEVERNNKK